MARLPKGPLIAKRFFVDFTFGITSEGPTTYTFNATVPEVPLDRTLIRKAGNYWGRSDGGGTGTYWHIDNGGVWFTSPTSLRLVYSGGLGGANNSLTGQTFRAEVIVLRAKPKSLQNLAGNGAASQTIAPVDTSKALIVDGIFRLHNSYHNIRPTFTSPTQVTWSEALTANDRYQVVEF